MKIVSTFEEIYELARYNNINISINSYEDLEILARMFIDNKNSINSDNIKYWEEYIENNTLEKDYLYETFNKERNGHYVNTAGFPKLGLWFNFNKCEDTLVKFEPKPYKVELI